MTEPRRIWVLLVDDHAMVRRDLVAFLLMFDDLELAGEAANGDEAVRRCAEARSDVVLMDLLMPEMDGVAATRAVRERFPTVRVIALTSSQAAWGNRRPPPWSQGVGTFPGILTTGPISTRAVAGCC